MAKIKTLYQCQSCGYSSPKWLGKCPDCGTWNSLVEERSEFKPLTKRTGNRPILLDALNASEGSRYKTDISELDRVLGGGVVPGSVILIGGDPGIGKSTLLLETMHGISKAINNSVLYVSGEESLAQIKMRSERLRIQSDKISLLSETNLENIMSSLKDVRSAALVVDSIQTVYTDEIASAAGSVGQIRECSSKLMIYAKQTGMPVFLIGHVTKEGALAGPRVLEHIVDTVLYFEGDRGHPYRVLRTVKNRFGSTNEIGVFEMADCGLTEITNPSSLFLSDRFEKVAGSAVTSSIEGTRPVLVEIQALVSRTSFGMPRRTTIGIDVNRVNLLIAVCEKIGGIPLGTMDVFINVVAGLRITEPAADLCVMMTIISSLREKPITENTIIFGEVGLTGEVRTVSQAETRIKEAKKLGFKKVIMPLGNERSNPDISDIQIIGVRDIHETIKTVFHNGV